MKKFERYRYLGKNGIITTSVFLEGNKPIYMLALVADENKILTDGERYLKQTEIFIEDLDKWSEVEIPKNSQV